MDKAISSGVVNEAERAERALAISYARVEDRPLLGALLNLDGVLGRIVRSTREPLVGQMRLTWWAEALERLDAGPALAEPVLRTLAGEVLTRGITGTELAAMVDGWEAMLAVTLATDDLRTCAAARGGALFGLFARVVEECVPEWVFHAGEGWALADLAGNLSDAELATSARRLAAERLAQARRWPRKLRPLGALALLARDDVAADPHPPGHPVRTARLLALRLFGR